MKRKSNEFLLTALDELVDKKTVSEIIYNHLKEDNLEKAKRLVKKFDISIYDLESKLEKKDSNKFYNIKDSFLISLFGKKEFLNLQIANVKESKNLENILGLVFMSYIISAVVTVTPFVIYELGILNFFMINLPVSIMFSISYLLYLKKKHYKLENKLKKLLEYSK